MSPPEHQACQYKTKYQDPGFLCVMIQLCGCIVAALFSSLGVSVTSIPLTCCCRHTWHQFSFLERGPDSAPTPDNSIIDGSVSTPQCVMSISRAKLRSLECFSNLCFLFFQNCDSRFLYFPASSLLVLPVILCSTVLSHFSGVFVLLTCVVSFLSQERHSLLLFSFRFLSSHFGGNLLFSWLLLFLLFHLFLGLLLLGSILFSPDLDTKTPYIF